MKANSPPATPVGKDASPLLRVWEEKVKTELRILLAEKNLSQKEVAYALEKAGVKESAKGLSAKLSSGTFSAAYYLALKEVLTTL